MSQALEEIESERRNVVMVVFGETD